MAQQKLDCIDEMEGREIMKDFFHIRQGPQLKCPEL